GTALQDAELTVDDFGGLDGCNEILNVTRPDVVRAVHRSYFEAGAVAVETNTFGANLPNLSEYGIFDRIVELSEAGARLAREVADEFATPEAPRFVLGSVGPGTKLPTLGHAPYTDLRDAYSQEVRGLLVGGVDAVTVETTGTMLLGTEIGAALNALEPLGIDLIGLNCSTGPAEMSEHLRTLSKHARVPLSVMPNAGLPELGPNGAVYPLSPDGLAEAL